MTIQQYALPIVDISGFRHGTSPEDAKIAQDLVSAFRGRGFAYVAGHGVAAEKVDRVFHQAKAIMSLSTEQKMVMVGGTDGKDQAGYAYPGMFKVIQDDHLTGEDLQNLLKGAPGSSESYRLSTIYGRQDRLPPSDAVPGFVSDFDSWGEECLVLYHKLLRILAMGLGLEIDYFAQYHAKTTFRNITIQHYLGGPVADNDTRLNEHTDYGFITLLFQDQVGGLEVMDAAADNQYIQAPPVQGAITVNIGDLMSRWTNGILRSTLHRVRTPPKVINNGIIPERYSIPCFCGPAPHTIIDPIPGTFGPGNPKLFDPVDSTQHIESRQAKSYMSTAEA